MNRLADLIERILRILDGPDTDAGSRQHRAELQEEALRQEFPEPEIRNMLER